MKYLQIVIKEIVFYTMAYKTPNVQKVMVQPINVIFRYLQSRARVVMWIMNRKNFRISGVILGFDEFLNVVLGEAEEHHIPSKTTKKLGKILLKGDNIALIQQASSEDVATTS